MLRNIFFQLPNRRLQFLHEIISLLKPWTEPTWNGVTTPPSTAHPGDSFEGIHHGCQPKRRLDFRFRNALFVAEKLAIIHRSSESSCWKSTVCVLRQKPTKSLCRCVTENKPQLLWSGRSLARIFVLDVSDGGWRQYQLDLWAGNSWEGEGDGREWWKEVRISTFWAVIWLCCADSIRKLIYTPLVSWVLDRLPARPVQRISRQMLVGTTSLGDFGGPTSTNQSITPFNSLHFCFFCGGNPWKLDVIA